MAKWYETGTLTLRQAVDIPPVWLALSLALVFAQTKVLPQATFAIRPLSALGAITVVAGVALMIWALLAFRKHQTSVVPHQMPQTLIRSGPYRFSRNPIYLGDVLVLVGAVLWWGAWPSLLLVPILMAILVRRFIAPEEARMKQNFGLEFEAFAEKTSRWL